MNESGRKVGCGARAARGMADGAMHGARRQHRKRARLGTEPGLGTEARDSNPEARDSNPVPEAHGIASVLSPERRLAAGSGPSRSPAPRVRLGRGAVTADSSPRFAAYSVLRVPRS
jgi:hypothetical protein